MPSSVNIEAQDAPAGLQRMWYQARARAAGSACPSTDISDTLEAFDPIQDSTGEKLDGKQLQGYSDPESDYDDLFDETNEQDRNERSRRFQKWRSREPLVLEASTLGDMPTFYEIAPLLPHQFPVIGVYIDKRVNVGFKYKVKPMMSWDAANKSKRLPYLFHGKALRLLSIGRGYARRFTFESVNSTLNDNENYFWGDSRPEGFAFEIEVVSVGDKFTVFDPNNEAQGTLEVVQLQKEQFEQEQNILEDDSIEKKVEIYALCKVEWYERSCEMPLVPIMGTALVKKPKGKSTSALVNIIDVDIGSKRIKRGYELRPGVQSSLRRTTVTGETIGDVPTKYSIVGLENYEFPVIGTFVDPRIVSGFHYRVRLPDSRRYLFNGRSLLLESIGRGYGKRLSFTPDNFNSPENYLWSDSHSSGVGFEPRAVHTGMKFTVIANNKHLGEATVFRADMPQIEEKMEIIPMPGRNKNAVEKHIHIDVTCHVKLATTGGGSVDSEVHLMRVSGVALVRKNPDSAKARLLKVYNVGLDSQLNQLFVQSQTELTFLHI